MGLLSKIVLLGVVAFAIFAGVQINKLLQEPPMPKLADTWWGKGQAAAKEDTSVTPFKINVPEKVIIDLNDRLKNARQFTPPLEGVQQQYGINSNLLSNIVEFWKTKYNWREREQWLNQYPQFTTNVQGLKIHFLHVKPKAPTGVRVLPLLMLHGWPGSVREFYEIIPLLTTVQKGKDFVFEVIVPSLPGYGFSEGASKPGLGAAQMSVLFKNLMLRLRLDKFYVQGGDWGAMIVANMATLFPEHVLGLHSNMCFSDAPITNLKLLLGSVYPPLVVDEKFAKKLYPLSNMFSNFMLEFGYMHLQATKPDTVGVGLNDSPVGLAAYILEKFTTWTNPAWKSRDDGGLNEKFTYTSLLDNVMIYWVTNSITTSVRLYAETFNKEQSAMGLAGIAIKVPSACIRFENELAYQPDNLLAHKYANLVQSTDMPNGGHFAAFEVPDVLANDIWAAVTKFETMYGK